MNRRVFSNRIALGLGFAALIVSPGGAPAAAETELPRWVESNASGIQGFAATTPEVAESVMKCISSQAARQTLEGLTTGFYEEGNSPGESIVMAYTTYLSASCDSFPQSQLSEFAMCFDNNCTGRVAATGDSVKFEIFDTSSSAYDRYEQCTERVFDDQTCAAEAGCEHSFNDDGSESVYCGLDTITATGVSFTVDMAKWRAELGIEEQPASSADATDANEPASVNSSAASLTASDALPGSDWRSTFSNLRLFGPLPEEALRLATTTGAAVVLGLLVLLPTQLINSTLEANAERVNRLLARLRRSTKATPTQTTRVKTTTRAAIVLLAASIITGFANPDFGFNLGSLWFVATALVAFIVLNVIGTVLVWRLFHRRYGADLPALRVHYSYLLLVAVTVLTSRLLGFEPALIFGAVIAIETGRIVLASADERRSLAVSGRLQLASGAVVVGLGVLAWAGYNLLVASALATGADTAPAQELTAGLTTEALATLPVLLLPLRFLPGAALYAWNKRVWAASYLVALTLFVFVLMPLPSSWSTISTSFTAWIGIILGYAVFAVLLWTVFALTRKPKPESEQQSKEAVPAAVSIDEA